MCSSIGLQGALCAPCIKEVGETNDCWRNTKNTPSFAPTNVFLYDGLPRVQQFDFIPQRGLTFDCLLALKFN